MLRRLLFWLLLTADLLPALAQLLAPTTLTTALSRPAAPVGTELDVLVQAKIQAKWHLYATDFDPNVGPAVFTLVFPKNPAYELVGAPQSVGSQHHHDDVFKGEVAFWENTGLVRQRIRVLKPGVLTIQASAEYQTCSDADGRCVPGTTALTFGPLTVRAAAAAKASGPPAGKPKSRATIAPAAAKPITPASPTPAPTSRAAAPVVTNAPRPTPAAPVAVPTPVASPTRATLPKATPVARAAAGAAPATGGLWRFGLLAFLSGLAALLTPCVFPMVPLTVSLFTGHDDSRRRGIAKALAYGLSIIGIYTIMGVAVARLLGEEGPNFLATHWLPNLLFFVVFVAFGLSFLGLFEITLPTGLVNRADRQADKGGWGGIFFAAFTLVLVSFSCTGPIVATILSLSARGETLRPVVGMLGFSLAFALPFTLFAIFPAWLKSLPKSGGWLNTVKVTLGFAELLLALKFLSTADLVYHWHLLPRDLYLVIWLGLAALLALYLLGKIRFAHDGAVPYLSVGRALAGAAVVAFMAYLVPGLFGAPLPLLAGYLPPPSARDFTLAAASPGPVAQPVGLASAPRETPRFGDFLEVPLGLPGYFDLAQARRAAQRQHKPLFVDFTGHGCVNCRKMEASVWSDPAVLDRLRRDYIVVSLYVDDKTELPPSEWYTSPRDKQLKTSLGKQNADLQITRYGVNAQPYYVLLDPGPDAAAPLVPPVAYEPDAARFAGFLAAGLRRYQQPALTAAR